jgi:hypothetical protein
VTGPPEPRIAGSRRGAARMTAESALLGLLAGAAVVAPWTRAGYLLLLDWVAGPHRAIASGVYGLDPAALDALPYRLATHLLREAIGPGATNWLMVLLFFPIAAGGVSALAGGGRWRRHTAALFAVCNPFVLQRLQAGQVPFLLSVSLLSWLLASAVAARREGRAFAVRPAAWYALAMAVGPYAAWLGGAGLLAVAVLPRLRRNDLTRTLLVILMAGWAYVYALPVMLRGVTSFRVTDLDLDVYAPRAGPGGLLPTLAGLWGFWRGGNGILAVTALMVVAVAAGLILLSGRDSVLAAPLTALAVTGLLLGAGVRGPLAPLYRAALDAVPLFEVMRDQQKWVALAMLAYAVAFGVTAETLVTLLRRPRARLSAAGGLVALAAVVAAVAPSLLWGLGASVRVSHYPHAWAEADELMGDGSESVLFLPWHQYQPFAFTGSRTVATPAAAFFRRPVISSDAAELGGVRTNSASRRTAYVQRLVAAGGTGHFGRLVAPLGVRYIVLARDDEAGAYAWLERQADLRPLLRTPELDLYRVEADGTGRVVAARTGGYEEAELLAGQGSLGNEALLPGGPPSGTVPSTASGGLHRTGNTSWQVAPGAPGWVVVPVEWSPGWSAGNLPTSPTAAGTVAVRAGPAALTVEYTTWRWLRLGLAASLSALAALVIAGLASRWLGGRRRAGLGDGAAVAWPRRPARGAATSRTWRP